MKNPVIRCGGAPIVAAVMFCSVTAASRAQVDRHWLTPADGLWTTGARWTGGAEPLPEDSAFIDVSGGPYVVTLDQNRTITNFTIVAPTVGSTLRLSNGAVLTMTGNYLQDGNIVEGSTGAAVNIAGTTTLRSTRLTNLPSLTAAGSLVLEGVGGLLFTNSTINLTGATGTWQGPSTIVFAGGADPSGLSIGASSVFTVANDRNASWNNIGTRPTLANAGTFVKNGGTGTTSVLRVNLNNTGTVRAATGTLRFDTIANFAAGILTGGTWRVENNATLEFIGQNVTTNRGTVELNGANSTFAAINGLATNDTAGTLRLLGSRDFTAQGAFTNNGAIDLSAGSVLSVTAGNTYTSTGGNVTGAGLTSVLMTAGNAVLQGGSLSGITLMSMGNLLITGGTDLICEETCIDHNGLGGAWEGTGGIGLGGGSNFSIGGGSTFGFSNQQTMEWDTLGAQPTLSIEGTILRDSAGTTTSINGVVFSNTGAVTVQSGILFADTVQNLAGGTLTDGSWEVMDDGTLDFNGEAITTNQATVILDGVGSSFDAFDTVTTNGVDGTLILKNGRTFVAPDDFTNDGVIDVLGNTGPAVFEIISGSGLTNFNGGSGTLSGGVFNIVGPGRDSATVEIEGLDILTLDGSITLDGVGANIIDPLAVGDQDALRNLFRVDNSGAIVITGGKNFDTLADLTVASTGQLTTGLDSTFTVSGDLTNFDAAGRFADGDFTVGGTFRSDNALLVTLANTLTLDGAGRIERPDGAGGFTDALPTLTTIDTIGNLTIRNGHQLTLNPHDFATLEGGSVTVGPPAAVLGDTFLHVQGSFNHDGSLTLDDGLVRVDGDFNNSGLVFGDGAIDIPTGRLFVNNGVIEPGGSPGILSITGGGDLQMGDLGEIIIEIAGLVPGTGHDQLRIDGALLFEQGLAGRIEVVVDPGFTPLMGQRFEILVFEGGFEGWFEELAISDIFRQIREEDRFILEVIPTPGTGAVLGLGGLLAMRRRRQSRDA
jgi:fibronectin-binding autotransporter adhesin